MIIIHTKLPKSVSKKKRRPKGPLAKKLDINTLIKYNTNKLPTYDYCPRPAAENARKIQSHVTTTQFIPARQSMTDAMSLAKESQETQDAIMSKTRRLAPLYSKGPVQLMSDDTDYRTVGRKI